MIDTLKLEPTDHSMASGKHQPIKCLICDSTFVATPKSKIANFRKHGYAGCSGCTLKSKTAEARGSYTSKLLDMGYIIQGACTGLQKPVTVCNTKCGCGRCWTTTPGRIIHNTSFCKPCNDDRKRTRFQEQNTLRRKTEDGTFDAYCRVVRRLTEITYKTHQNILNPDNQLRVRSKDGVDGYQLDHIVSVKLCFSKNVPAELCASLDNLQMLPRMDNAKKWSKPSTIPKSFRPYFGSKFDLLTKLSDKLVSSGILPADIKTMDSNPIDLLISNGLAVYVVDFSTHVEGQLKTKQYLSRVRQQLIDTGHKWLILFENELLDDKLLDICVSRILNKLGNPLIRRIFARHTTVKA